MNIFQVLKEGKEKLKSRNIPDYDFDALCLLEESFGFSKNDYFLNRFATADAEKATKFFSFIERRMNGEPLQYIMGKWQFMTGEFYVGNGVLIPRSDTEILVEVAADFIRKNKVKTVYDLCSGSGCVGISIAMMFPDIKVFCVELSDVAFSFLEKNIVLNNVENITAIKGDITECFSDIDISNIDVLLSNPPYIKSEEISQLSVEVQNEPHMALDGGEDGFFFYDVIADCWLPRLKKDAFAAFECGETQARKLADKFSAYSDSVNIHNDLNGIERVVSMIKK